MHPAAHKLAFALFCFIKETLKADTLFILLMGCVIGLKLCESCVFGNEIIVCNSDFELKYEWKYELHYNVLLTSGFFHFTKNAKLCNTNDPNPECTEDVCDKALQP